MNGDQLRVRWRARDALYRNRRINGLPAPLSREEVASIMAWRRRELNDSAPIGRDHAWAALLTWQPPTVLA